MAGMRSRARTVAAVSFVVGAWLACGPLTSERDQQLREPITGLGDGGIKINDAIFDFDAPPDLFIAPPDIPMEGGGPDAFAPPDIPREGGGPDAPPFDAFRPFDGLVPPDIGFTFPDAGVFDARAPFDAFPDAARPPDAAVIADAPPDSPPRDAGAGADSSTRFDAGGGGGPSLRYDDISFYDCRCAGSHAPVGGWPIFGAILFVIVRRRSGSSSAR